ncbi:hypothetical protein DACRYDRAFT_104999 [Dacryopinax primogenitus]|uniref:Arrestin-like N-terminal domain-containing protein n=1 Tax=Dacryopinax primogenitus (strain DJM 731) TaxID=1858805 RepID=M5G9X2_DACPD|nr:uncharacterized protein DACRYDRAFT_104999 [Dacryopinax primogenitus]EJU05115.1 hypothetical protein DACRYDRAFT_104999 [Dacryopinax primogenitus]
MFTRITSSFRRTSLPLPQPTQSQYAPPPAPDGTLSTLSPAQPALEPHPETDDLPIYISPSELARSVHTFALKTNGEPWLSLSLSSSAGQATSHPLFFDTAVFQGNVTLILGKELQLQTITLLLEGFTRTAGSEQKTFLSLSTLLFPPSEPAPGDSTKLTQGTHAFPFDFALPPTVTVPYEGGTVIAPLPPTYSTKGFPAFLEYQLTVVVHRGALRVDNTLSTTVVYLPRSRPKPPSPARQLAYQNLTQPPGPEEDPEGWAEVGTELRGRMFGSLEIGVRCTMHLARPLCYARGTPIPFLITFLSPQPQASQALDLLTQPSNLKLTLEQIVTVGPDALRTKNALQSQGNPSNTFGRIVAVARGGVVLPDQPGPGAGAGERRIRGEIPVPRELKPSFTFVRFTLSYKINLLLDAVGFLPEKHTHAVLSQQVAITTDLPRGPRQPPPVPSSGGKRSSVDGPGPGNGLGGPGGTSGDTVNLLLLGNQRYMQHHHAGPQ